MPMHPPVFYKYSTADTIEKVLATGRLRWSDPRHFNDLNEFQRVPRFAQSLRHALEELPSVYVQAVYDGRELDEGRLTHQATQLLTATKQMKESGWTKAEAQDALASLPSNADSPDEVHAKAIATFTKENLLAGARILCVTTDSTNAAMWDHYAEGHAGVVIGLRHVPERSTALLAAKQVAYTDEATELGSGLEFLLYGESDTLIATSLDAVIYTKGHDYAFEREWRAVTWRKDESGASFGDYPFLPEELESVTFGARTHPVSEARIRTLVLAAYPSASLFKIVSARGELQRVPVDSIRSRSEHGLLLTLRPEYYEQVVFKCGRFAAELVSFVDMTGLLTRVGVLLAPWMDHMAVCARRGTARCHGACGGFDDESC